MTDSLGTNSSGGILNRFLRIWMMAGAAPWGGGKGQPSPKGFKERKMRKCGVFSCIEVIKIDSFCHLKQGNTCSLGLLL